MCLKENTKKLFPHTFKEVSLLFNRHMLCYVKVMSMQQTESKSVFEEYMIDIQIVHTYRR